MSKNSSLSHQVANDLRRDIVAGVLAPGSWLKTEELAARYQVSANPVREALWKLQGEGFVVANPNQGARVRAVDEDFVRNIFEIREALEPLIVRRFCQRATAADLDRLREAAAEFARVAARKTIVFEALDAANRNFHAIITEGEVNLQALEVMERYADLINADAGEAADLARAPQDAGRAPRRDREGNRLGRCGGSQPRGRRPCPRGWGGHARTDAASENEQRAGRGRSRTPAGLAPQGRRRILTGREGFTVAPIERRPHFLRPLLYMT